MIAVQSAELNRGLERNPAPRYAMASAMRSRTKGVRRWYAIVMREVEVMDLVAQLPAAPWRMRGKISIFG